MSYSMIGATGDCPTGPANAFKLVNGIAKPTNCTALEAFQAFQTQLARFGALRVDGDIGPATVKLYNKVSGGPFTAAQIATAIPGNTMLLKLKADGESKPAAKPIPPSRPAVKDGVVVEMNPPPYTPETLMDTVMGFVTSPMGLLAGAGVVGLLIFMKRKKSGTTSSAISVPEVP